MDEPRTTDLERSSTEKVLLQQSLGGLQNRPIQPLNNPDRWGASRPPAGRKDGHQWGEKVAADGEFSMAIDTRVHHASGVLQEIPLDARELAVPARRL